MSYFMTPQHFPLALDVFVRFWCQCLAGMYSTLLFKSLLLDQPYIPCFTSWLSSSLTMRLSLAHKYVWMSHQLSLSCSCLNLRTSFVSSIFNMIVSKHSAWTLVNAVFFKNEPRLCIQDPLFSTNPHHFTFSMPIWFTITPRFNPSSLSPSARHHWGSPTRQKFVLRQLVKFGRRKQQRKQARY